MRFHEVHARSVLNRVPAASRMPFRWTVNPYRGCGHACVYCFARRTHTYLGFDAGRDFEREIVVKVNAPEVLRAELARRSWQGEHVALGTNTDPYQWVEGRYRLMEGIWAALRDAANPCSVLTKSPLVLRDLPLLVEIAARTQISASLSIPTLDERAWRATEPHTPHPRARQTKNPACASASASRSGRRAQPRRHPDGGADCAADARDQRCAAPTRALAGGRQRRRRDEHRRPRPASAGRRQGDLHELGARAAAEGGASAARRARPQTGLLADGRA